MTNLSHITCFLLDMDGTVYLGDKLLPGALEFLQQAKQAGSDLLFLTNNSSRSTAYYAEKLTRMGWPASPQDILTSGMATAAYIHSLQPKARVYLVGTQELADEFSTWGLILTSDAPDFVVLGFDTTLTYHKLQTACQLITDGVCYIATHPDINCPTETGYIPDCGAMIALIQASTGRLPKVIGKPNKEIIEAAFSRKPYSTRQMAMIGDRLYTDMATAKNAGITGILVLSGETKQEHLAESPIEPDYVFDNLGELAYRLRQTE
ncbi:HAD family hydrolase [Anaerosporomusa subterranea]|uniref:Acid sugar phosphatase n=1 Tax=Anaerosporomusa subterranea TaxID=1794912 RepID=A0A154BNV5_ANASB|nr:HAD-IIA family hydrolase [Anaerosporomusa subterranea]KYZ75591.1 HAD family hydrolase [Anaerosporomusa subterranea]